MFSSEWSLAEPVAMNSNTPTKKMLMFIFVEEEVKKTETMSEFRV